VHARLRLIAQEKVDRKGEFPGPDEAASEQNPQPLPAGYEKEAKNAARKRVVVAGYRLGNCLAAIGNSHP
jgi:hypothetical protein